MVTPYIKLRPFNGQEEATSWWQDFTNFAKLFGYNDEQQCLLFPFYFEGTVKLWQQDLPNATKQSMTHQEQAFDNVVDIHEYDVLH